MKNLLLFLFCVVVFSALNGQAYASGSRFDNFSYNVSEENLEAFTKDMAGLIGSGTYSTGRILGWGGFLLSGRGAAMPKTSKKNTALGKDDEVMYMPWIQGEIGLPFRLDGYIRASSWNGLTVAGGGLKWGVTRPVDTLYSFQTMITVLAQSAVHKDFTMTHYNANLVVSFKMPVVTPYIGGGVDYARLTVEGAADTSLINKTEYTTTPRASAGLNFKLPEYMDLSLAANYASYGFGGEASFGVRF